MTNEQVIKAWYEEVWNKKSEDAIDKFMAKDCIAHGLVDDLGQEIVGSEKFKEMFKRFVDSFPGITTTIEDIISEGNKIAARITVRVEHTGKPMALTADKSLPASGKKSEFSGISITVIKDDKIAEAWNSFDFLTMYTQLGAL